MDAAQHGQCHFVKNFQTPYDQCQNYILLRITGDDYRIVITHTHTHTHTHCVKNIVYVHIYIWW